ncbi:hypothetical protein [Thermodesulfovibrio yellowstonii]|uniref:hypothetical protein n=1 Tax=Thermodesulfovibrio yellowstonii TaxID=28262 RepID=UPI003C7CFD93
MKNYKNIGLLTLKGERFAKPEYAKHLVGLSKAYGFTAKNSKGGVAKDGCFVIDLRVYYPFFLVILLGVIAKEVGIKEDKEKARDLMRQIYQVEVNKFPDFEPSIDKLKSLLLSHVHNHKLSEIVDFLTKTIQLKNYCTNLLLFFLTAVEQGNLSDEPYISLYVKFFEELERLKKVGYLNEDYTFKGSLIKFLDYIKRLIWERVDKIPAKNIMEHKPIKVCLACGKAFIPNKNRIFCNENACQKVRNTIKAKINYYKNKKQYKKIVKNYLKIREEYSQLSLSEQKKTREQIIKEFDTLFPKEFILSKQTTQGK